MKILDRYASAIRSSNLKSDPRSTMSDTDVLGAMGLAAKHEPLAAALQRLFCGDNSAAVQIVEILSDEAWKQARGMRVKLNRVQALDMARVCLAWHRDGTCKPCGGHGVTLIPGTRTLGTQKCKPCQGEGKVSFERQLPAPQRELARWLISRMEECQSRAGPEAMKKLRETME
ncbi:MULTISPECIES: hypothetical protein [unclassified Variovorax]|uniref:hypothetical protein n=1 Tax=unclassified Variovorax TaxID=663243 RepID=UPI00076CD672|nr:MULTISPECIES: hypothetical protein [unclassified Variovorax]KWT72247.1 hypothetical protein APY03_6272 [Variovorax sp. WDL1]PNG53195.1 hypothetical protein CHC06_04541 [Variovorax sp. B2]PNG53767.1 hypothetical protein CHC07_03588 [Variovorax sp. B4]VTV11221.1 hypothetical protein WDL1CHR_02102 [Variovorax sp. WDL1]